MVQLCREDCCFSSNAWFSWSEDICLSLLFVIGVFLSVSAGSFDLCEPFSPCDFLSGDLNEFLPSTLSWGGPALSRVWPCTTSGPACLLWWASCLNRLILFSLSEFFLNSPMYFCFGRPSLPILVLMSLIWIIRRYCSSEVLSSDKDKVISLTWLVGLYLDAFWGDRPPPTDPRRVPSPPVFSGDSFWRAFCEDLAIESAIWLISKMSSAFDARTWLDWLEADYLFNWESLAWDL